MDKVKYGEIDALNKDQIDLIKRNGWIIYTICCESDDYYVKGLAWANRIGYAVLEKEIKCEDYDFLKYAVYDDDFDKKIHELLIPIKDKCYQFYVSNDEKCYYATKQIWTNKGLEQAKILAAKEFEGNSFVYLPREKYEWAREQLAMHKKDEERKEYDDKRMKDSSKEVSHPNRKEMNHPIQIYEYCKHNEIYIDNFYPKIPDMYIGIMLGMVASGTLKRKEFHTIITYLQESVKQDEEFRTSGRGIDLGIDYERLYEVIDQYINF